MPSLPAIPIYLKRNPGCTMVVTTNPFAIQLSVGDFMVCQVLFTDEIFVIYYFNSQLNKDSQTIGADRWFVSDSVEMACEDVCMLCEEYCLFIESVEKKALVAHYN
jgi:hypothetical protein